MESYSNNVHYFTMNRAPAQLLRQWMIVSNRGLIVPAYCLLYSSKCLNLLDHFNLGTEWRFENQLQETATQIKC